MSKISSGFVWLENETTGDPSGVRRARDGVEFTVPAVSGAMTQADCAAAVVSIANGAVSAIQYDGSGRITSMTTPSGATTLTYDAAGRVQTVTAGGVTRTVSYNSDGSVATIL